MSAVRIQELYRGYLDSPINTDNAWTEALVLRINVPFVQLDQTSVLKLLSVVGEYFPW